MYVKYAEKNYQIFIVKKQISILNFTRPFYSEKVESVRIWC